MKKEKLVKFLEEHGIHNVKEIVYNPTYEELFVEETKPELEGFEKGQVTELGAVNVMTGVYTGRSPKDKFIVEDENSKETICGQVQNIKMITIELVKKLGMNAKKSQQMNYQIKDYL